MPWRWVGAFLVGALLFRLAIVITWHAPAGDGVQYYQLSQELRRAARYAYAPPPAPLSYSRLPGYPLFLAATVSPFHPLPLGVHVVWATVENVLLDLATALLVFLILHERRMRGAKLALALVVLCPTLWLVSCFALSESLSTFLGVLELFLALRALERRPLLYAALAGAVAGFAQLTRADALTFAAGVLIILCALQHRRLAAMVSFAAAALAVFAPWLIRNQIEFGATHAASTTWRKMDGAPLGDGPIAWARTWSTSQPGEAWFDLMMANDAPLEINRPGVVLPAMYDNAGERAHVVQLFERYNRERLSPSLDAAFMQLAEERKARAPLRFWVTLPLKRMLVLWSPAPPWELPFRVGWLGMPTLRPALGWLDKLLFVAALAGAIVWWRREQERLLLLGLIACVAARTLLYGFAIPHGVGGRYLVEAFPLFILMAAQLANARATSDSRS